MRILLFLMLISGSVLAQVPKKGLVNQIMSGGRIVDGQVVVAGDLPYFKSQGQPFSVMIVPKDSENAKEIETIKARYYQGDTVKDIPLMVNSWNTTMLVYISTDNASLFDDYYVYVGFGDDVIGL